MEFSLESLSARAKEAVALSTAVYMFGFLARRAQLHMLGVEAQVPLLDQLYLETGGKYLVLSLREALIVFTVAALAISILRALVRRLPRAWFLNRKSSLLIGVATTCFAIGGFEYVHNDVWSTTERTWQAFAHDSGAPHTKYRWLIGFAVLTACMTWWLRRRQSELGDWRAVLTVVSFGSLSLQLLRLPMDFGILYQTVSYPRVQLLDATGRLLASDSQNDPFLLLETDKALVLGTTGGTVVTMQRGAVSAIRITRWANLFSNWRRPR